jgi:hypothetical protein
MIPEPIQRFAAAVRSGDVDALKRAYPGLTPSQQKNWETVFKQSKPEAATITDIRGVSRNITTGITVVEFAMAVSFSDRTTGTPVATRPTRYRATIKQEGTNAFLQSLAEVARR